MHVNFQISLASASTSKASFGVPLLALEHSITANRQDGPYSTVAEAGADGFTLAAAPIAYNWATQLMAQLPHTQQFMIGRRAASEHIVTSMDAIEAVDPGAWWQTHLATRNAAEIRALAGWTESRNKTAMVQSSSAAMLAGTTMTAMTDQFTVGGTATSGVYSISVVDDFTGAVVGVASVTADVPGTHADHDAIATALRAAWDAVPALAAISAAAAGSGAEIDITYDGLGNSYTATLVAPAPGTLTNTGATIGVQNPGELLYDAAYDNTAIWYHDDDTEYMDGSIAGRCLAFALDSPLGSGSWAHHVPKGITATRLTTAQKTELLDKNVNWVSPVRYTSGVEESGFSFPGRMASGRSIKIQTSLHWLRARLEERLLKTFLEKAKTTAPAVLFSSAGLSLLQTAAADVFRLGVKGGHFADNVVSESTGRVTPWVDVPAPSELSSAAKQAGLVTSMTAEAIVLPEILSVGDATTVGFTIDLAFA